MSRVTVTGTSTNNNVTFYHITTKIPLRTLTVSRRYSEFTELVYNLCDHLGIDAKDFPYKLPPKSSIFTKNNASTIEERKLKLGEFLNELINDREIQNLSALHEFLQLPVKFKFTSNLLNNKNDTISDLIISDYKAIDNTKWLEYLRLFKSHVRQLTNTFNQEHNINNKFDIRNKLLLIVMPNLTKLIKCLDYLYKHHQIDDDELQRRKLLVKELNNEITQLNSSIESGNSQTHNVGDSDTSSTKRSLMGAKRVFGSPLPPQETKETLPLSNQELLQQQVQVQHNQDNELLELRKIIARQKEIGMTINQEVEEQNELLDSLNEQVDHTTDKLRLARKKAKQVL